MAAYSVTTAGAAFAFTTSSLYYTNIFSVDTNHFFSFNIDFNGSSRANILAVNTSTWAITTANSYLELAGSNNIAACAIKIDTNHFLTLRSNYINTSNSNGYAQVLTVNTSTWAITTASTALNYNSAIYRRSAMCLIDANHVIAGTPGFDNTTGHDRTFFNCFAINTSSWAVSTASTEFKHTDNEFNSGVFSILKINDTHILSIFYSPLIAQVLAVNTSTWAITTAANYCYIGDGSTSGAASAYLIDSNHVIIFFSGTDTDGFAQVYTINTSTWAITTAGSALEFDTQDCVYDSVSCYQVDTNHFINFWTGYQEDGFVQTFAVNTSTWAITTAGSALEFDTQYANRNKCIKIDTSHFLNEWYGYATGNALGTLQVFYVEPAPIGPVNLKTYNTNLKANIKSINTNVIANCKSLNTNV